MKKLVPLTKSKAYVEFTRKRDHALEGILAVHLRAIDTLIGKLRTKILYALHDKRAVQHFVKHSQGPIRQEFDLCASQIATIMKRLRAEAYFLAHASECEAIGRALQKKTSYSIRTKVHVERPMHDGALLEDRAQIMMDRLRRKLEDALSLSLVLNATPEETVWRVKRVFGSPGPRPQPYRGQLRRLKVTEAEYSPSDPGSTMVSGAEDPEPVSMSFGFADDNLWGEIRSDYTAENLPGDIFARGPTDKVLFYDTTLGTQDERYAWEVENEVTHDFVQSVRDGTIDAANENGINDFQWVAILDSDTDECCRDRDGFSSAEIEKKLSDGTLDADECDESVPPGHFNCRCRAVPMTTDMPDKVEPDYQSFNDWIDSQGKAA